MIIIDWMFHESTHLPWIAFNGGLEASNDLFGLGGSSFNSNKKFMNQKSWLAINSCNLKSLFLLPKQATIAKIKSLILIILLDFFGN